MDFNVSSYSFDSHEFNPELLLQTVLLTNITSILCSDYYDTSIFDWAGVYRGIQIIPAMTVTAHSNCLQDSVNIELACRNCNAQQLLFLGNLASAENHYKEELTKWIEDPYVSERLHFTHSSKITPELMEDICGLKNITGCSNQLLTVAKPSQLSADSVVAIARKLGLIVILQYEGRYSAECVSLYRYLGVDYLSCKDTSMCLEGSGFPGNPLGDYSDNYYNRELESILFPKTSLLQKATEFIKKIFA